MTGRLARIHRHPVKAIGFEELAAVELTEGRVLPFDRHWAVAHERAKFGERPEGWAHKMNFLRGVTGNSLMAIRAGFDAATGRLELRHPEAEDIALDPETEGARLVAWLRPLWPEDSPAPVRVVSVPGQAMTDVPDPFVSLLSLSSLAELSERAGREMSPHRFRGNLWVTGWEPWAEFDLIGRTIRIGDAELQVAERITRCKATHVDPATGVADTDTLELLRGGWGHQDFGVYCRVTRGGRIAGGDPVVVA